ncbi:unnamed protein product, partial [Effrenium voratum]
AFIDIAENWPKVKWQRTARWCTDGKFYSSSGVAAGIDLTHFFLKELFGEKVAKMTAKCAEYVHNDDPGEDPFVHSKTFDLKNPFGKPLQLVVVVYDQFEMWDTFGPLEMFSMANRLNGPAFEVKVVAEDFETKSFGGPWFQCEALASGAEGDIDLLLLPGGIGTLREIYNPVFSKAICAMVAKAQRVMTVCTGSAILASQNLLQNRKVTTNKMSFDLMALFGPADWVPSARWVRDEKFWTSSGVSAGTDLSLALMREVFGADLAEAAAEATEYVWSKDDDGSKDPFAESIPEQTLGHRLELMLLANQAVATKILNTFPMFGVLRRHPPPKDDQLKTLQNLLAKNGLENFHFGSNKELSDSLQRAVKPEDPFFNTLVRIMTTRCMNQAVYFCTGEVQPALYSHYGLAMERYTHFTSPIRRYADVLVHRLLAASLGIATLPEQLQSKAAISEQCEKINVKHRMAQFASRASADLHTFMFFNKKGEQSAEAIVMRIRRSGMQVNVPRYGIEGVVAMPEEEWEVREDEQFIQSKKEAGRIDIFAHIIVTIQSDNSDFRNRTHIRFERIVTDSEREEYKDVEESRKQVQKEMFPDLLEREAN